MNKKGKYKISLRMRVTLITGASMAAIGLLLSAVILYNAQTFIIGPTTIMDEPTGEPGTALAQSVSNVGTPEIATPDVSNPIVVFNNDSELFYNDIELFYSFTFAGIIGSLLVGIILIYFVVGMSLKPVSYLRDEIAAVDEKDLSKRIIDFSAGDELDSLAKSFNQMLDRIETAFKRERTFSSGAAHELRTPLAVIRANLDVLHLSDSPSIEEYEETLNVVKKQIERMTKLIDDLFSMYALEGYEIKENVQVDRMIEEVVSDQQASAEKKKLIVEMQCTQSTVKANEVMLKHALLNIIQNAIKYNTENGKLTIAVTEKDGYCVISVSDTGIGISPEAAEHIFEPFYREDKSRSRKIGGAGLGLSITKNIIEQHGGAVEYQPNTPRGSIFILKIPTIEM